MNRSASRDIPAQVRDLLSSPRDRAFLQRVYATPASVYETRLRAVGFAGLGHVLDAGCGMGQWSFALAALNQRVTAVDRGAERIAACRALAVTQGLDPDQFQQQTLEELKFEDGSFDGIFCYSTLYYTDVSKSLDHFARLLKPGGRIYICANDVGWYLYNLLHEPNPTPDFDPREMAAAAIADSIAYYAGGPRPREDLILPAGVLRDALKSRGFDKIQSAPEGTLDFADVNPKPFFAATFMGYPNIYELVATRGAP